MYKWEGSGPMPAGGPAAGAYTWSSTSVQGSTASGTRQQGGLGRILNFIPGLRRKGSSTEGVASTSGVSGAASTSARVSGQAVNVQMVGSGGSTQAEGAGELMFLCNMLMCVARKYFTSRSNEFNKKIQ